MGSSPYNGNTKDGDMRESQSWEECMHESEDDISSQKLRVDKQAPMSLANQTV